MEQAFQCRLPLWRRRLTAWLTRVGGFYVLISLISSVSWNQVEDSDSPPDPAETLIKTYRAVVDQLQDEQALVMGGKSMGGRIASLLADEFSLSGRIRACLCLGYPFNPLGRPQSQRIDHLRSLRVPLLVVQGERDRWASRKMSAPTPCQRQFNSIGC